MIGHISSHISSIAICAMDAVLTNSDLISSILRHIGDFRCVARTRRVAKAWLVAVDAIPPSSLRPRIILACSRTARFIAMDPAGRALVGEEGRWPALRRSQCTMASQSKAKAEPSWITGICINPDDGDIYALQYKVRPAVQAVQRS